MARSDTMQTYAAAIYRLAVLRHSDEEQPAATLQSINQRLTTLWQQRVQELQEQNWFRSAVLAGIALRCRSRFYHGGGSLSRRCRMPAVCPFCCGQAASELFQRLVPLLCAEPPEPAAYHGAPLRAITLGAVESVAKKELPRQATTLVLRRYSRKIPECDQTYASSPLEWLQAYLKAAIQGRQRRMRRLLRSRAISGAFSRVVLVPAAKPGWIVHLYELYQTADISLLPSTFRGHYQQYSQPTRSQLVELVSAAWQYPQRLLTSSLIRVLPVFQAITRQRSTAMFGTFRGGKRGQSL